MRYQTVFDPTFGLSEASFAVAALLGTVEHIEGGEGDSEITKKMLEEIEIKSYTFLNGRERSICLGVGLWIYSKWGYIIFGECRSSDNIFVDTWLTELPYNQAPTVHDFTDEVFSKRTTFKHNEHSRAADHIKGLIKSYIVLLSNEFYEIQVKKALTV